jgi:hypothetical protein
MKTTIARVDQPLRPEAAFALVGGVAVYLLAHVAFRYRHIRTVSKERLLLAAALLAYAPVADEPRAVVTLAVASAAMVALIAYETIRFAEGRQQIRRASG